jgi:hypothetical protein
MFSIHQICVLHLEWVTKFYINKQVKLYFFVYSGHFLGNQKLIDAELSKIVCC